MADSEAEEVAKELESELREHLQSRLSELLDQRELRLRSESGLREMVEHALPLIMHAPPGEVRVRVANATIAGSERTILEILLPDQPFLVDTLRLNIRRFGLREIMLTHQGLAIEREFDGSIAHIGSDAVGGGREAYLYAEVPLVGSAKQRAWLEESLRRVYTDLQAVVRDHGRMVRALRAHTADIELAAKGISGGRTRAREIMDFLGWLADENYVFFGYRGYDVSRERGEWSVKVRPSSGLGVMQGPAASRFIDGLSGDEIPELVRKRLSGDELIFFDKSRTTSKIHRDGRLDCMTIKLLDEAGQVSGFGRFVGMLTYKAIGGRGSQLPILRMRKQQVLESIGTEPGSYGHKAAITSFDSLPLEFLFSFELDDIETAIRRILRATETGDVEAAVIPDPQNRSFFVSVILPRSLYRENLRGDIQQLLTEKYRTVHVDHRISFVDEDVALIHFFCSCADNVEPQALDELENDVRERARPWGDRFEAAVLRRSWETRPFELVGEYAPAFLEEYRVFTAPEEAACDVERLERLRGGDVDVELAFIHDDDGDASPTVRLKIYRKANPYLTDLLPTIDQFGLCVIDATLTELSCPTYGRFWIVTFRVNKISPQAAIRLADEARITEGLRRALSGEVESGGLNGLILAAGLEWQEVDLLRAYVTYAQQLGSAPRQLIIADTLGRHPAATRALVELFRARFDPDAGGDREDAELRRSAELMQQREQITTAQEDRVFAMLQNLVQATLRTDFFTVSDGGPHRVVLKLDPQRIEQMPAPRPHAEIFVHSARMSGIHLRGGKIARGGVRWSDRLQDFRTEVLGLMKTQMVKNGLIVPVGAKGGFILKTRFDDPLEARAEADLQYAHFIRAMLSVTDDIVAGQIRTPDRVVRHDGDDPYLVVAADKGTAHLSDVANRVAEEAGFWLRDAFASGGSQGYDHRAEGITAKGAWVCVKRHLLELGTDAESEIFSMAGIGDMSGDVFGNGLLLARNAKLLAAFNHQHIFIDPDPDPRRTWKERKRLFELPHSTWRDYDAALISEGGGVFDRDARSIRLSAQARKVIDVSSELVSGEELVRAILRMPVDLLWNGGIGTYVKASSESHAAVGDRANDGVRINGAELRARVVGEGGNLGLTQLARVEYALAGGRINTDALDNSAGVDLSDHEVNFKILLAPRCHAGEMSREERNTVLRGCIEQAGAAVLRHTRLQSRCISMEQLRDQSDTDRLCLAAGFLEKHGGLDPQLEFLPDPEEIRARGTQPQGASGYTRPELALLVGYTKMFVKRELSCCELMDHQAFRPELEAYFAQMLRERFAEEIAGHHLRREITASCLTNYVIDLAGVTLIPELVGVAGVSVGEAIAAYYTCDRLLEAIELRRRIQRQPVAEHVRLSALLRIEESVRAAARAHIGLEAQLCLADQEFLRWSEHVRDLTEIVAAQLSESDRNGVEERASSLTSSGLDRELALEIELLPVIVRTMGVISLALDGDLSLRRAVELHAWIGREARIGWLLDQLAELERHDGWDRIAVESTSLDMLEAQRRLTASLLGVRGDDEAVSCFRARHQKTFGQIEEAVRTIEADGSPSLAALVVLSRQIRRLC
jgi:glutamate dehydrogenase